MNKKMYLTAAEAKAMNLPSMDEQIARHNALMEALRKERLAELKAAGRDAETAA